MGVIPKFLKLGKLKLILTSGFKTNLKLKIK